MDEDENVAELQKQTVEENLQHEEDESEAIFIEGVEEDEEGGGEEKEEESSGKGKEEETKTDPDNIEALRAEIYDLKTKRNELQRALSQARQEKTKTNEDTRGAATLTEAQIKQLMNEHRDDPDVMYNILKYVAGQSSMQQINAERTARIKAEHDNYVSNRWPDLMDENSPLNISARNTMHLLQLENHPLGQYLALSALICEKLPEFQQKAYESGKAEALEGKAEKSRGKGVKMDIITPPGSGKKKGERDNLSSEFLKTANQMNMSPSQRKIYARLLANKE